MYIYIYLYIHIYYMYIYIYRYLHRNFQKYSTKLEMTIVLEGDWNKFEIGMGGCWKWIFTFIYIAWIVLQ